MRWDETSSIRRPERVSPWELEPATSPLSLTAHPAPRNKRSRSTVLTSSSDSSVLTREGMSFTFFHTFLFSNSLFIWMCILGQSKTLADHPYTNEGQDNDAVAGQRPVTWMSMFSQTHRDSKESEGKFNMLGVSWSGLGSPLSTLKESCSPAVTNQVKVGGLTDLSLLPSPLKPQSSQSFKIFGINLNASMMTSETESQRSDPSHQHDTVNIQPHDVESKAQYNPDTTDQEKQSQPRMHAPSKGQNSLTRSCRKVYILN